MLNYHAVRAKWETQTQRDTQSRQQLVSRPTGANINTQTRQKSSTFDKLTASDLNTSKSNRLASLVMFNKSLTSLRPKGFSRHCQPSANNEASQSTMTLIGSNRDSFNPTAPLSSPFTAMQPKRPAPLVRSSTTSYLPVPTKPATTSPDKQPTLMQSRTTSLFRSRIPTPPGRQPNYIPRSTTQPHLPTVAPRRAAELFRPQPQQLQPQKRFGVSKWSFAEESKPLLETQNDNYNPMRTPSVSSSSEGGSPRQQFSIPRRTDSLPQQSRGKENTHHVIQCHHLLQPVQPLSPKSTTVPEPAPPPLPGFFNTPGSTPPLQGKRKSRPAPTRKQPSEPSRLPTPPSQSPQSPQEPPPASIGDLIALKQVHTAMPNGYWAGRFCSLNDELMNQIFDAESKASDQFFPASFTSDSSAESSRRSGGSKRPVAPPGSAAQALHVLRALESMCATEQARRSLLLFRNMYAINHDMHHLMVEVPKQSPVAVFKSQSDETTRKFSDSSTTSNQSRGGTRKFTFMDRLRGRKSRNGSGKS